MKVRPVVVVSNDEFNDSSEDALVVGVTSNISKDRYTVPLSQQNLEEGILRHLCCIKAENLLKIENKLVVKKIGKIDITTFNKIKEIILSLL